MLEDLFWAVSFSGNMFWVFDIGCILGVCKAFLYTFLQILWATFLANRGLTICRIERTIMKINLSHKPLMSCYNSTKFSFL